MSFKSTLSFTLFFIASFLQLSAKQGVLKPDSLNAKAAVVAKLDTLDDVQNAVADTITPKLLRLPDSLSQALMVDSLKMGFGFKKIDFKALINDFLLHSFKKQTYQKGELLARGQTWTLMVVVLLLLAFAIYKNSFAKQLWAIVQSFFSNRALGNLNKEENLFNSWPFILLFVQFGFTVGLYLFLAISRQHVNKAYEFNYFITVSVSVVALCAFKIILLRIVGFFLQIQKPISEYISILYLSYFNLYLLFVPLTFAYALSPISYDKFYMVLGIGLFVFIFGFQLIRAAMNILFNYQFSKVYLFVYFCALEICPILIFIKTIGWRGN